MYENENHAQYRWFRGLRQPNLTQVDTGQNDYSDSLSALSFYVLLSCL